MTIRTGEFVSLFGLDPATYEPHQLHAGGQTYSETNCYTDILLELIHARGDDPRAVLGSTVRVDFEGDQWTFFKPDPADLEGLLGIDIHEMQPLRPLPLVIADLIASGRTMTVELDAWHLPDTAATSYRTDHVKTSVAPEGIDVAGERLRYFHNMSLHELSGADYRKVFRLDGLSSGDVLPPYMELVRFDAGERLRGAELRAAARTALRRHLAHRPDGNPFDRFGAQLESDLPGLLAGDEAMYHAYAFATVRMAGAAFELLAAHVEWLFGGDAQAGMPAGRSADAVAAAEALTDIVEGCKLLGFKLARRRPFDAATLLGTMASAWTRAMTALDAAVG